MRMKSVIKPTKVKSITGVKYLKASTTGAIMSLYASICTYKKILVFALKKKKNSSDIILFMRNLANIIPDLQ